MPIKPENKLRYPSNWKQIRTSILERAHNCCEFCGVENHTYRYNDRTKHMVRIVLTIAHLDHTPEHCSPENLRALCQRCHNRYDAEHRKETRSNNKKVKRMVGILVLTDKYKNSYAKEVKRSGKTSSSIRK